MSEAKSLLTTGTHQKIMSLKAGEHFYSDLPSNSFTYVKTRYNIQLKTERFICVNEKTMKAIKITKVTRIT